MHVAQILAAPAGNFYFERVGLPKRVLSRIEADPCADRFHGSDLRRCVRRQNARLVCESCSAECKG